MEINLGHSIIVLRKDDVIQVECTNHSYSVDDLKEINAVIAKICNGKKKLLLGIFSEFSDIDTGGREYMASDETTQHSIAEAYILKSLSQKILANFYLTVNKPNVPTKFFSNITAAEKWLKSFV